MLAMALLRVLQTVFVAAVLLSLCHCQENEKTCVNGNLVVLSCPEGFIIDILSATYQSNNGRFSCKDPYANEKVKNLCNGQNTCTFSCTDDVFKDSTCTTKKEILKASYVCKPNPCNLVCCANGGSCRLTIDMEPVCDCIHLWRGDHCNDDPCNTKTCQNGGSCAVDLPSGAAQCYCTAEFTGVNCETKVNPCNDITCQNGGSCAVNPNDGTAQCYCTTKFTGENCETEVNPCNAITCQNGGSCAVNPSDGTAQCCCPPKFTGETCETEVNPCNSITCQNGGSCAVNPKDDGAKCYCTTKFTGENCETEVNPCNAITCQNGGSCAVNPSDGTAQCCCPPKFTGETCETEVDACILVNCQNGGSCSINGNGLPECQCMAGFGGELCDIACNQPRTSCPAGWQMIPPGSGNCYYICNVDSESWLAAEDYCLASGASLWEPNTPAEKNAVTAVLNVNQQYWTGAFDGIHEGTTKFVGTGEAFTLPFTGTNTADKDCVEVVRTSVASGWEFQYRACTVSTRRCICETLNPCQGGPALPILPP